VRNDVIVGNRIYEIIGKRIIYYETGSFYIVVCWKNRCSWKSRHQQKVFFSV